MVANSTDWYAFSEHFSPWWTESCFQSQDLNASALVNLSSNWHSSLIKFTNEVQPRWPSQVLHPRTSGHNVTHLDLGVLPRGVTGKDVIVALCMSPFSLLSCIWVRLCHSYLLTSTGGLFNNDEVLNHAIEFTGSGETMRSLPVDDRLAIANMTTECESTAPCISYH